MRRNRRKKNPRSEELSFLAKAPFITRKIGTYDILDEEGLIAIEKNADRILAEVGVEVRNDPPSLELFRQAGADIKGERVRFEPGFCKSLIIEYAPNEYNDLLNPMLSGFADVVYGSRFMGSKPHRVLFYWHTIGNKFLTNLSNMFTNLNLTDMETCYKLFKSEHIKSLNLKENRFGFEPEVTAKISRIPKISIYEVGISYYGRTYAEGKKIGAKDGFRAIYCILKYGLFRA